MAKLKNLIKYKRYQLDEKRRAAGEILEHINDIDRYVQGLDQSLLDEQAAMAEHAPDHETIADYNSYAEGVAFKKEHIATVRANLQQQYDAAQEQVLEAFRELKKFELTHEAQEKAKKAAFAKKETATLDDIAIEQHQRKQE